MGDNGICSMKKSSFKNLIKRYWRTATFSSIKEIQLTHTKVITILYPEYTIQQYLSTPALKIEESSTLLMQELIK